MNGESIPATHGVPAPPAQDALTSAALAARMSDGSATDEQDALARAIWGAEGLTGSRPGLAATSASPDVGQSLIEAIRSVLTEHDPVGIASSEEPDEYLPEAETIAVRLLDLAGQIGHEGRAANVRGLLAPAVRRIVHQEFTSWFGAGTAGPEDRYAGIAEAIAASLAK